MLRIQFNGMASFYSLEFSTAGEDVVLKGKKFPKNVNKGFKAYRLNGDFLGDYSDFTEAEEIDNGYIFKRGA